MKKTVEVIKTFVDGAHNKMEAIEEIRNFLFTISPLNKQPIDLVRWVPLEMVLPNDYNPNSVAKIEMKLLLRSITHDNYTQPIVTIYDEDKKKYIIVDGFHRYFVMKTNKEIYDRTGGLLPITVLDKGVNDRMASTVRHNRARGKHSISGMSKMVFTMLSNGWADDAICNELGMEPEELLKLKHITGYSKLFKDIKYNKSWQTKKQIQIRKKYEESIDGGTQAETDGA